MATVSQSGVYNLQAFTSLGALGVGYRLYTYTAGTTTHKTAYTDSAGAVAHTYTSDGSGGQYIAMDARGELPAPLYLTSGAYDLALKTAAGATVWTRQADPVGADLAADAVTFLPAGVGAVAQTVQEKVRRVEWSPEDFGAAETYDSTVDDRPFLELARDAVFNAGGGTVILNRKYALNSFETSYVMLRPKTGVSWKGKNKYRCGLRVGDGLRSTSQGITVLYDHTNFIYDIEMSNFFVDFNGQNNLLLAGYGSSGRVNRLGGNIAADVTCRDMVFKNSAGHHFIWFGLASVDSRNDNCEVINCSFLECGQSISGNETTDHSSIYLGCTGGRVIGNKFKNTTQDYVATAIEVHSNDALVSDNWVQMFNHGANIGGDSNTQSGTQFANNIFRAVVRGIVVWTGDTYTVDLLSITGNTITLVDPEGTIYAPGGGIVYTGGFDTSTATSSGWVIANNDISMESNHTAALTYANTGIGINPVNGLLIEGNRVNGLKAEGVRLDVVATKNHTNATVRNNSIVGCGFTTAAGRRQGIHALSNVATYIDTNTTIEGNQIVAGHVGSGVDMDYGIALNGTGQFQNLRILDNDVVGASIQDIYTPTAQTQTTKPYIRHETSGAGHPLNLAIRAGWGSTWVNKASGYSFEFRNKAGTNGSEDGWNATVYGVGDPNSTSPFNTAGTAWKKGDTYIEAFPDAGTAKSWRCTTAGTSAPAAAVWTEV